MTKFFTYCFDKWWRPVLFFGVTVVLFVLSDFVNNPKIQNYLFLLFGIGLLGLIISTIYQLAKRRKRFAVYTTLIIGVSIFGFSLYSIAMFWKLQAEPDTYADNLKIPNNIRLNLPLESIEPNSVSNTDFFLYKSLQPGLYQYVFYTNKIKKGQVYLKAFEITHNDPLSVDDLKKDSKINVLNQSNTTVRFVMDRGNSEYGKPFTIYEGDWGKPYAARFELWFVPADGEPELKLIEKNYKIEGWQR